VGFLDPHALLLDGLAAWFGEHAPDLDQVACSTSFAEFARSPSFPPDVVVLGLAPDDRAALEAAVRACRDAGASVVVISDVVGSDSGAPDAAQRLLDAGAGAVVPKAGPARDLLVAVRRVLRARAAGTLTPWDGPARVTSGAPEPGIRFTEDEEETLRLYASGHSPVEVAMILGTNIQAVKNALDRVREKYTSEGRVADRKQDLVLRAAEDGYLA
jgi:DNA-binding NarL/FixJ family response regulator